MNKLNPTKEVYVYDNVLSSHEQQNILLYCTNSVYRIAGWSDLVYSKEGYVHSWWAKEDLERSGFLDNANVREVIKEQGLSLDNFDHCVVNLDTISDSHWPHTHVETVLLYYINMEWQEGWGGETLFYDEYGRDIIYGSKFTPNRIIVFDGKIPHNIKHQNRIADKYRMTLSIFFKSKEV